MTPARAIPPPAARVAAARGAAAVLAAPGRVRLRRVARREPGSGEVEVRVEGCGVCGSNVPVWAGRPWFAYPLRPGSPGHEGWGEVVRVGDGVTSLRAGQRVAFLSDTSFAEYDTVGADGAVPLPAALDGLPFPGEALGCVVNVMRRAAVRAGDLVAVVGVGFLGALVTNAAARAGAHVIALSRRPFALEVARQMGADAALRMADRGDAPARVAALAGGELCDVVVEATGSQHGLDLAAELVRVRGRLVVAGYHQDGPRQVNMQLWNWRGIDVVNAHERDRPVYVRGIQDAAREVAAGRLDVGPLLTHLFPLARLGDALEVASARPPGFLKAVVMP